MSEPLESATWTEHDRGIVRVRMVREIVDTFWTRTQDGRRVTVAWGEPDAEGFYEPVFTATDDGFGDLDAAWAEAEAALQPDYTDDDPEDRYAVGYFAGWCAHRAALAAKLREVGR